MQCFSHETFSISVIMTNWLIVTTWLHFCQTSVQEYAYTNLYSCVIWILNLKMCVHVGGVWVCVCVSRIGVKATVYPKHAVYNLIPHFVTDIIRRFPWHPGWICPYWLDFSPRTKKQADVMFICYSNLALERQQTESQFLLKTNINMGYAKNP